MEKNQHTLTLFTGKLSYLWFMGW